MKVSLRGSSPCATTAGILLMSKARQLGLRLTAVLVGDPTDIAKLSGPTVVYCPVLASCNIGREFGQGATVVVPGPMGEPIQASLSANGVETWFLVDRSGTGQHPATQAFVRLCRDPRPEAKRLIAHLQYILEAVGAPADPAVLDVLFGAPTSALTRLSLALRIGRVLTGKRGEPITAFLSGIELDVTPYSYAIDLDAFRTRWYTGEYDGLLAALSPVILVKTAQWMSSARSLSKADGGRNDALFQSVIEILRHLARLPVPSILSPLSAIDDAIAMGIVQALGANRNDDPNFQLKQTFEFLGGKYDKDATDGYSHPTSEPPPADPIERWRWFCAQAEAGRSWADELWPTVFDSPQ